MEITSPPPCPNTVTVRRNPHRRARPTTTPATVAPQMKIPTAAEVRAFPTDEILSIDISNAKSAAVSKNLRVFLRIRPLLLPKRDKNGAVGGDRNPKTKPTFKNVWPQNPSKKNSATEKALQKSKKKNSEVCVKVATSQSVTLSPPPALQETNRAKTEVYDGFSHVFSPDSSQEEVYEKMVRPLVVEFLSGKSGMLAALGPSGSGKTHTVFGSPRQPGMVPLALQQIFKETSRSDSKSKRAFFISIFEISSERGKGERLFDLSPHGSDLSMQQSTLKGLQEVAISDAREAESIIAQAMLKRATATTNSNSQSSRSQCIINIRGVAEKCTGEDNVQASDGVLSIVDLAGAEREKRTGNQGARLLESNFINNTSMVFGLCLRSLLEHQKNPKKPLQKHFQNSLLTKYLRDYLEGKKRMALILTVKSGEDDYRDTSYMLRQASPYMEIKYNCVEQPSSTSYNKRHFQASSTTTSDHHKRMKFTGSDPCAIEEGKRIEAENRISEEASEKSTEDLGINKVDMNGCTPSKSVSVDSGQSDRNHQIMQSFAKVIWNVLKQYSEKLKVVDNEIQHLKESLMTEHTRNLDLGKELKDIKSCCSCSHRKSVDVTLVEANTNFEERVPLVGHESGNADETSYSRECDGSCTLEKLDSAESTARKDQNFPSPVQVKEGASPFIMTGFRCIENGEDSDATIMQSNNNEQDASVKSSDVGEVGDSCLELENPYHKDHQIKQACVNLSGHIHTAEDLSEFNYARKEYSYSSAVVAGSIGNSSQSSVMHRKDSCSSVELDHLLSEADEESLEDAAFAGRSNADGWIDGECRLGTSSQALQLEKSGRSASPSSCQSPKHFSALDVEGKVEKPQELPKFPTAPKKDVVPTKVCDIIDVPDDEPRVKTSTKVCDIIDVPDDEARVKTSTKVCDIIDVRDDEPRVKTSTNAEKPKRRLLPVSSMLLRDFSSLYVDNDNEKPKGRKKSAVEKGKRTQASTTLMRLLQKNLGI